MLARVRIGGARPAWRIALGVLLLLAGCDLSAHKVTPDPLVEVFLQPTADHLTVKVWLPMTALGDANLPRTPDGHLTPDQIGAALDIVARGIARDLQLQQGESALPAPTIGTTLSPDESFVAIDLVYPLSQSGGLSARFHTYRGDGQLIATKVHYIVNSQTTRDFLIDSQPQRIAFAPSALQVLRHFIDAASDMLFDGADFLLLAICLIAVARPRQTMWLAVASAILGQVVTLCLSAAGLLALSTSATFVAAAVTASVVVMVAILDVASPQSRRIAALCLAFGVTSGPAISARLLNDWGFTGSHSALGLLAYTLTLILGEIWLVALLWSAAELIRRRGRIAELAVMSTAIFAGHAALHRLFDQGQALADAGTFGLDRFLFAIVAAWAMLILVCGIVETMLFGRRAQPLVASRETGSS